jgi:hypothetical protein
VLLDRSTSIVDFMLCMDVFLYSFVQRCVSEMSRARALSMSRPKPEHYPYISIYTV